MTSVTPVSYTHLNNGIKTFVAVGIGAALFFVLGRFVAIPSPVPNTNISLQYAVLGLLAAMYGPVAGGLIGFIGHAPVSDTHLDVYKRQGDKKVSIFAGAGAAKLQKKTVTPTESQQTVTPDTGYDGMSQVTVEAVPAGYIGSGVTKKAAATYTPKSTDQVIAAGQYLSGAQTIKGDANLVGGNILAGKSIFGVAGTVVIQKFYIGSSEPSSSTGSNGDLYLQTGG